MTTEFNRQADIERVLQYLDVEAMVNCLCDLLRIPSVTGSAAESDAQHWFADLLRESGFETDLWQIDLDSTLHDPLFPGLEAPRTEAWGLVGRWGNTSGPSLILNGHMDVVPPGAINQWHDGAPFSGRLEAGVVYGRGACDMKAGLVCNLYAIKALQAAGVRLTGNVLLQSVVGEEDGGLGTFATLLRGYRADAAIITEPTELAIIPACAGALTFRLHVSGLSAHASVRREGVSAIEKFWQVWQALERLEARRNESAHSLMQRYPLPYPLSIGTLHAGDWPSSVPDQLVAEGRLGVAIGEDPNVARQAFEQEVAEVCRQDAWMLAQPIGVEWFGGQFASGYISSEHSLVTLVSDTHRALHGTTPAVHGAPYGSDLRLMTDIGNIPTLHYGPGSVKKAHAPNESVPVADMVTVAQTLIVLILNFCGYS